MTYDILLIQCAASFYFSLMISPCLPLPFFADFYLMSRYVNSRHGHFTFGFSRRARDIDIERGIALMNLLH